MRHFERRVAHLARLVAEYGAQQTLLGREVGFALRRDLTDENIARIDLRAYANDTVLVEVFERLGADVGNVARDFLRAELGVARFGLVFIDMNRSKYVVLGNALADKDSVLVVVSFPAHKSDEHVFAERELGLRRGMSVRKHLPRSHAFALAHYRTLVNARALVRADELFKYIHLRLAVVFLDDNTLRVHVIDNARRARDNHYARVVRNLVLDTRTHDRRFRL